MAFTGVTEGFPFKKGEGGFKKSRKGSLSEFCSPYEHFLTPERSKIRYKTYD